MSVMARAVFFLAIVLGALTSNGQFHALPQGHAIWAVSFWIGPGYPYELSMYDLDPAAPDTVISGVSYDLLGGTPVRDDLAGRVFFWDVGSAEEKLLYDFDVLPGDTILYPPGVVDGDTIHVIGVDTVDVAGTPRKQITVSLYQPGSWGECVWIQGIGSTGGPFNVCQGPSVSGTSWLTCMTEDGIFQFGGAVGQPGDCSMYYSTGPEHAHREFMKVHPNPGEDELFIERSSAGVAELSITGPDGRALNLQPIRSERLKVDMSHRPPGVYLITTKDASGSSRSVVWVKEP